MVDVAKVRVAVMDLALRAMVDRIENMLIVLPDIPFPVIRQLAAYILCRCTAAGSVDDWLTSPAFLLGAHPVQRHPGCRTVDALRLSSFLDRVRSQ
jgi:hypothetical protein